MSFVDPNIKTCCEAFLGVVILRADDREQAIRKAHVLGINPGGEVIVSELPSDPPTPTEVLSRIGRLLARPEAEIVVRALEDSWSKAS